MLKVPVVTAIFAAASCQRRGWAAAKARRVEVRLQTVLKQKRLEREGYRTEYPEALAHNDSTAARSPY
jgi:hypothetical protein